MYILLLASKRSQEHSYQSEIETPFRCVVLIGLLVGFCRFSINCRLDLEASQQVFGKSMTLSSATLSSNYNTRPRRKHSIATLATSNSTGDETIRSPKRLRRDVITPPASPQSVDAGGRHDADEDIDDPTLAGIIEYMDRCGVPSMCSREISEGMLTEGKVQLVGTTPSTVVDAAIKHYLKRCSALNKKPIIAKVSDPRYPRKTLFHLARIDPFSAPRPQDIPDLRILEPATPETRMSVDRESVASDSNHEMEVIDTLSNDGQGPFSAPPEERQRMSISPSPELELPSAAEELKRLQFARDTPQLTSAKKLQALALINITLPPSPFITPQNSDEESEHDSSLRLPASTFNNNSPLRHARKHEPSDFNDFNDFHVQAPEQISLIELDNLLDL